MKRVRKSRKKADLALGRLATLPEDIVEEILLRLPAKSIARFRAVSKSWHGLFSGRAFLRAHQERASPAVLLRHRSDSGFDWDSSIHTLRFGQQSATKLTLAASGLHHVALRGCCDGLLLLFSRPDHPYDRARGRPKYSVYNPTTREHVRLPAFLDYDLNVAGFYFHAPTAEYRVLWYRCHWTERVPRRLPPRQGQMMTRKHYAYSVAAAGRPGVRRLASTTYGGYTRWKLNDAPVFLHGCLHWMRRLQRVIVFDTVSEKFHGMRGPAVEDRFCMVVGRLVAMDDGTLGASSFAKGTMTADVWVLQDYGNETSWTLRYKVDVGFLGGGVEFQWLGIAHVTQAGDALFYGARRYGVYNLSERRVVSAGREIEGRLTATWHVYRESLVSLLHLGADPALTLHENI